MAHAARVLVWRWWKPRHHGVRVVALDAQGRLLLLRHSYGSPKWMPPGGGMRRGEDPLDAGVRELQEETGCALADARLLAVCEEALHGSANIVSVVRGRAEGPLRIDRREIVEAGFFPLDALPEPMPAGFPERLRAWAAAD
ncbi:NUDIX domain-containing protein [Novosphingobium soli]|uniref:NUDIX domain-containing protein n=1 Tax=Novosphingobium soli TaxID=574956 RepID=A0ABV6D0G5_9SPHN